MMLATVARRLPLLLCTALVVLVALAGCAALEPLPEGAVPSAEPDWSNSYESSRPRSELSGLSERSRQIERNLGVR